MNCRLQRCKSRRLNLLETIVNYPVPTVGLMAAAIEPHRAARQGLWLMQRRRYRRADL